MLILFQSKENKCRNPQHVVWSIQWWCLLCLMLRKDNRYACKWKQSWMVFYHEHIVHYEFTLEGYTVKSFIWDSCGIGYEESSLKCGLQESGTSITMMHLLAHHRKIDITWQKHSISTLTQHIPLFTRPIHCWLFSIS